MYMHKNNGLRIGILALQGNFSEHAAMLSGLGIESVLLKKASQLDDITGLIIPGGESTAIGHLIKSNDLVEPIVQFSISGRAILGTCAGMILCSSANIVSQESDALRLNLIDIDVQRNGFGRQQDSFEALLDIENVGKAIPSIFIRAPFITRKGDAVTALGYYQDRLIAAQQKNVLVTAFHPEITSDTRLLQYFLSLCR